MSSSSVYELNGRSVIKSWR